MITYQSLKWCSYKTRTLADASCSPLLLFWFQGGCILNSSRTSLASPRTPDDMANLNRVPVPFFVFCGATVLGMFLLAGQNHLVQVLLVVVPKLCGLLTALVCKGMIFHVE